MKYPYIKFEKTSLWATVDKAISDLVQNRDLELTTAKEHVVGYICEQLDQQRMINKTSLLPITE